MSYASTVAIHANPGVVNYSKVNEDSILAIQIFDQKKFKKKDQGFLGVINVRIGDVIELQMGGDGNSAVAFVKNTPY